MVQYHRSSHLYLDTSVSDTALEFLVVKPTSIETSDLLPHLETAIGPGKGKEGGIILDLSDIGPINSTYAAGIYTLRSRLAKQGRLLAVAKPAKYSQVVFNLLNSKSDPIYHDGYDACAASILDMTTGIPAPLYHGVSTVRYSVKYFRYDQKQFVALTLLGELRDPDVGCFDTNIKNIWEPRTVLDFSMLKSIGDQGVYAVARQLAKSYDEEGSGAAIVVSSGSRNSVRETFELIALNEFLFFTKEEAAKAIIAGGSKKTLKELKHWNTLSFMFPIHRNIPVDTKA